MNCPKCTRVMEAVDAGEYVVDRCTECSGMWFDLREQEHTGVHRRQVGFWGRRD